MLSTCGLLLTSRPLPAQNCHCRDNLSYLAAKVALNYPGYTDKVTARNAGAFRAFTDSLLQQADTTPPEQCFLLLRSWLRFFKDQHLDIAFSGAGKDSSFIRSLHAKEQRLALDTSSLKRHWQQAGGAGPEGIWQMEGGHYTVAVVKAANASRFLGVLLKADGVYWLPGEVKFELTPLGGEKYRALYKDGYHYPDTFTIRIRNGAFTLMRVKWEKQYPAAGTPVASNAAGAGRDFHFRALNRETSLLRLPSFDIGAKKTIDSMIARHFNDITRRPYLIIDVRNNIGGFNLSFEKLLPILYTGPVTSDGGRILATADNIALYEGMLRNKHIPDADKAQIRTLIRQLKAHKGGYYTTENEVFEAAAVYPYPEKIAIITNEQCASATELFIQKAQQSRKVTVFGRSTAGVIDYTSIIGPRQLPCPHYIYYCPTTKSKRLPQRPLDNIGIAPDVYIPDAAADWVAFVQQYLTKRL